MSVTANANAAPARPRAPVGGIPLVAGARLPLAFIAAGLAAFAGTAATLAAAPEVLGYPYLHPTLVALAHLALPGFLLSVCFGAVYQLMPVVLGPPLRLPLAAAWSHLALHLAGTALLVTGFARGHFALAGGGGALVAAGTAIFAAAVFRTFAAAERRDAIAWSFPLSAGWLALTVAVGVALAVNRRTPFLPWPVTDLLRAHAHLGLAGFFVTLLQGATLQLVPMFTLAELRRPRLVAAGLALAQAGLAGLVPALALDARPATIGAAALLAAGLACSGTALVATVRSRRRRDLEPGVRAFLFGLALLGAAAAGGLALAVLPEALPQAATVYGLAVVAGGLALAIAGMLGKIVPFLVWMRAYGPRAGRQPVPLAHALGWKPVELLWLRLHLGALTCLLAGAAGASPALLRAGTLLFAAAATCLLAHLGRVAWNLVRPAAAAAPAPRPALSPS